MTSGAVAAVVQGRNLRRLRPAWPGDAESTAPVRSWRTAALKGEAANINADMLDKDIFYLPETLSLSESLNAFKTAVHPFAVVVNEYALWWSLSQPLAHIH